jgi:hypothetical protein
MTNMPEILNLQYHQRRLLLKALNANKTKAAARRATGLTERTFFNMIDEYEIKKGDKGYYSKKQIEYKIIIVNETPNNVPALPDQP